MSLKNTSAVYGSLAKAFHWLMSILILCMLGVGLYMRDLPNDPTKFQIYGIHKSIGITLLALVIGRLTWRWMNVQPAFPESLSPVMKGLAHGVHWFLYGAMFAMPLSGWGMSSAAGYPVSFFGLFTLPPLVGKDPGLAKFLQQTHEWVAYVLIAALVLHVGAALFHHFWHKDNVLRRMLP